MATYVLLGDSTLDNNYWVPQKSSVTDRLKSKLTGHIVINLAVDGFTTQDMLNGNYRDKAVSSNTHKHKFYKPLETLKKIKKCDHIILSVGGNDFREKLRKLTFKTAAQRKSAIDEISLEISSNYLKLLKKIKTLKPHAKVTILLQYTPCVKNDLYCIYFLMSAIAKQRSLSNNFSTYFSLATHYCLGLSTQEQQSAVEQLHNLMASIYRKIFQTLIHKNISVIDLSSSFNPNDEELYISQIEPSSKGSELIANMITEAIKAAPEQTTSQLYSKPSQVDNSPTQAISLQLIAKNWRPGRVHNTEKSAIKAFEYACNATGNSWWHNSTHTDTNDGTPNKTLSKLINNARRGIESDQRIKIMQRLGFINAKKECTQEHSTVFNLLTPNNLT